jgi:hypothetical protein
MILAAEQHFSTGDGLVIFGGYICLTIFVLALVWFLTRK